MANLAGGAIKASAPFQLYRRLALGGDGIAVQTITGPVTITVQHEELLVINGGVATRILTLPTVAAGAKKGMLFCIRNSGTTNDLTINKPAATTIASLNPGEFCIVAHDGSAWVVAANSSNPTFDILGGVNVWTGSNDFGDTVFKVDVIAESDAGDGVTIDGVLLKDAHIVDSVGFYDAAAPTKIVRMDAGAVTAGQTRVLSMPDQNVTITVAAASILDDVSEAAICSTLGLGTEDSPAFTDLALTGTHYKISGGIGAGSGVLIELEGPTGATGIKRFAWENTVAAAGVETALFTVPNNSVVESVQANCMTALTGGGTTVSWSIGITGDVDAYGTVGNPTDSLVQFGKADWMGAIAANAGASLGKFSGLTVDMKLCAAATGGATAGNTALSVGTVKVRVVYSTLVSLANA